MNSKLALPIIILACVAIGWWAQPLLTDDPAAPDPPRGSSSAPPMVAPGTVPDQRQPPPPTGSATAPTTDPLQRDARFPDGREVYNFDRVNPPMPEQLRLLTDSASAGILVDPQARTILWSKQAHELKPIASMTKLMTLYLAVNAIREPGGPTLNDQVTISAGAASMGGTQVWLAAGEVFPLGDLLTAMMVESANDAAYAVGEYLGDGDLETFITHMNREARFLGMRSARFYNTHGLPGATLQQENRSSPIDLAVLALELQHYPVALQFSSQTTAEFLREGREPLPMRNHNRLLGTVDGVTGMKTGFSRRAGFCLTATAYRDDALLIAVVTGFATKTARNECVEKLFDWGYEVRQQR